MMITNKKNQRKVARFGFVFLIGIIANFNLVCAQKIRTMEHTNKNLERLSTAKGHFVDTLDIQIKITQLYRPEVVRLSARQVQALPQNYWVIVTDPTSNDQQQDKNIFILSNLDFRSEDSAFYNSKNWQLNFGSKENNPFIDSFGQSICQSFLVEIFNHRANLITFDPTKIFSVDQAGHRFSVMSKDELSAAIEKNIEEIRTIYERERSNIQKGKTILDNLFLSNNILSHSRVEGLLCFPKRDNKVTLLKIVFPNVNFYETSWRPFQSDLEISVSDKFSNN